MLNNCVTTVCNNHVFYIGKNQYSSYEKIIQHICCKLNAMPYTYTLKPAHITLFTLFSPNFSAFPITKCVISTNKVNMYVLSIAMVEIKRLELCLDGTCHALVESQVSRITPETLGDSKAPSVTVDQEIVACHYNLLAVIMVRRCSGPAILIYNICILLFLCYFFPGYYCHRCYCGVELFQWNYPCTISIRPPHRITTYKGVLDIQFSSLFGGLFCVLATCFLYVDAS